jgi:predicted ester cyclase
MEGFYPNDSDTGGVLHWRFTGTHKGELMGIAPTDNPVSIEGMTLSRHQDGKIYEEQFLWDRLEQLRQLGVSPDELEG